MLNIVPKPSRDYESAIYAEADFMEGRDFYVRQPGHIWHGLPVGRGDLVRSGEKMVLITFRGGAECVEITVAGRPPVLFDRRKS